MKTGKTRSLKKLASGPCVAFLALSMTFGVSAVRADSETSMPSLQEMFLSPIMDVVHAVEARLASLETTVASFAGSFNSRQITSQELCIADQSGAQTCITKAQLDALLVGMARTAAAEPAETVVEVAPAIIVAQAVLEPAVIEPAAVEPAVIEPAAVEPAVIEPTAVEPAVIDPAVVEAAVIDPAVVEAAVIEPAAVEPAVIEPAAVEPAVIEPAVVEDAVTEPAVRPQFPLTLPRSTSCLRSTSRRLQVRCPRRRRVSHLSRILTWNHSLRALRPRPSERWIHRTSCGRHLPPIDFNWAPLRGAFFVRSRRGKMVESNRHKQSRWVDHVAAHIIDLAANQCVH